MSDPRSQLAERQADLLRTLAGQRGPAPGFDQRELEAVAESLRRKRYRAAARAWPALIAALGPEAETAFAEFASHTPLPEHGGPLADGRGFVDFLRPSGRLPEPGRLEAFFVDLHHARRAGGLGPRRGVFFKCLFLRRPPRLVVGFRLPWLGVRWFSLHLGG